jgi:Prolipoprotein diacylglyceryltransferase
MLGLIPYFDVPVLELGPIVIDSWATLVALGFILGLEIVRARGIKLGLDVRDVVDGVVVIVGMGFVVGHIVHVVAYNPHQLEEQGVWALLKVWAGFSSTGGFIGAVIGAVLFYRVIRPRPFWIHADTVMFGFPFAWVLGRLGCFTAHDHVGKRSDFFLAVDFPERFYGGPRHDLGLYEALWTMGIAALFFAFRNRAVKPGFFMALFCMTYAPIRFILDFLRNEDLRGADVRWVGLTPAQWGMIAMFVTGAVLLVRLRSPAADAVAPAGSGEE